MAAPNRIPDRLGAPQVSAARQASSAESGSLLPAALAGLAASALAVWVVSGELRFAALTFTAMRYVAAAYLLLMAGLAWITCYGVGRLLRRKATRQVALHTAVTALWLAPAAIFLRDHSEWSSLAVGALVISVARLTGSFRDPVSEERFDQPRIPFGEIQASIPPGELAPALGAVLLIEGAFAAILAERPLVAALFVALGAWICIRRL